MSMAGVADDIADLIPKAAKYGRLGAKIIPGVGNIIAAIDAVGEIAGVINDWKDDDGPGGGANGPSDGSALTGPQFFDWVNNTWTPNIGGIGTQVDAVVDGYVQTFRMLSAFLYTDNPNPAPVAGAPDQTAQEIWAKVNNISTWLIPYFDGLTHYTFDQAGLEQFQEDIDNQLVAGEGPIVRVTVGGLNVPAINPRYVVFLGPDQQTYFNIFDILRALSGDTHYHPDF